MKISFLDMNAPYLELKKELDEAYYRFMNSGWYVLGSEVDNFEEKFASFCGTKYCIGVSNGLDALCLSLEAGGIKPGDEVIVPANTYIATWLAVSQVGAIPVPVEPSLSNFNIDPNLIEDAITSRTKAIIAVHLYGIPAEMDKILSIANRNNLLLIEDCAQAQGAFYKEKRTGNLGHIGAFSFYPAKNLGAFGEAGGITTNDESIARKVRILRNYGSQKKYYNEVKGYNRRIDGLQAAFLNVKLNKLDEWNERRKIIAECYKNELMKVQLPIVSLSSSVWHQFVIQLKSRDEIQNKLNNIGIPTMIHYPIPPHLSEAYVDLGYKLGDFPISESLARNSLSLPIGPHMKKSECIYISEQINNITTSL